ncbi:MULTISPECIES: hypothetical protein [unclassified Streptomyces]
MELCTVVALGGLAALVMLIGSAVYVDTSSEADTDEDTGPGEHVAL